MLNDLQSNVSVSQSEPLPLQTVYGCIMNHTAQWEAMAPTFNAAPYNASPAAPVLYIKPFNTLVFNNDPLALPPGCSQVSVCAQLGLVWLGQQRWQLRLCHDATAHQLNWFRPPVRANAYDSSLAVGSAMVELAFDSIDDYVSALQFTTLVYAQGDTSATSATISWNLSGLLQTPIDFISLIKQCVALEPGDMILLGACHTPIPLQLGDLIHTEYAPYSLRSYIVTNNRVAL